MTTLVLENNYENVSIQLLDTGFDDYIDKIKQINTDVEQASIHGFEYNESIANSSFNEDSIQVDSTSINDQISLYSSQSYDTRNELTVIGFKVCTVNNFKLNFESPNWFNDIKTIFDDETDKMKLNDAKRNAVLKDLRLRNIREHWNIDKISSPYENVNMFNN